MKLARHGAFALLDALLAVAVWGLAVFAAGQPARAAANNILPYTVRGWQTDDGLPQNSVWALAQTGDGYLWVGTQQGLARFDGVRFVVVDDPAVPELKHAWITALCATHDGGLWIACDGEGVVRYAKGSWARFTEKSGLPGSQPRTLLEDSSGAVWIGFEGGLACYRDGKFKVYGTQDGLGDNSVRALCEDRHGVVWAGTKRGLSRLGRGGRFETTIFPGGWNVNALREVTEDRKGRLWIGTTEGLVIQEGSKVEVMGTGEGLPNSIINAVFEDHLGQLWVATYGGLARLVEGQLSTWPDSSAVFGDLINTILEDREDNLWVGARDGLFRLSPARFVTYTTQRGLSGNNVMSVCEGQDGAIWLGIWSGGLDALRGNTVVHYGTTNVSTRDSVLSLCLATNGGLWVGMDFEGGLEQLAGGGRMAGPRPPGLINAPIRAIRQDAQGRLWVGTSRGLNVLEGETCHTYTTTNGLPGDTVMALCEDPGGGVWVGTDGGLARWSAGKLDPVVDAQGASLGWINALYLDRDHNLWVGTRGSGLSRVQSGKVFAFTSREGLFSDEIYEIVEDDFGYMWMSCRRGLFRVWKKDFDEVQSGARKALGCTVFGKADGLESVQFNGVAKPAGLKARDGRLWFPSIRGVVAVESKLKTNGQPPPVVIEGISSDRKPAPLVASRPGVVLAPGRGEVEIQYTALSLQAPEKNRFKYRLRGADSDWVEAGGQRVAHYNNLAPGEYTFQVIACNNDGIWNEAGANLSLTVLPHFWQTWWFKAGSVAAIFLLLFAAYHIRVSRLKEIERLRVQIAENLHDDVGARLTKVGMIAEMVDQETKESDPQKPQVRAIFNTTRGIIQAMDEIVWTINPKNDTLENLANYIFQHAQEYFEDTAVRCRIDMPSELPHYRLSTELRHNLFMAVKEALTNALKHAGATEVKVKLSTSERRLRIEVSDDGRGFVREEADPSRNGLRNMKERLERVGGSFSLESRPGGGTRVVLEVEGS